MITKYNTYYSCITMLLESYIIIEQKNGNG